MENGEHFNNWISSYPTVQMSPYPTLYSDWMVNDYSMAFIGGQESYIDVGAASNAYIVSPNDRRFIPYNGNYFTNQRFPPRTPVYKKERTSFNTEDSGSNPALSTSLPNNDNGMDDSFDAKSDPSLNESSILNCSNFSLSEIWSENLNDSLPSENEVVNISEPPIFKSPIKKPYTGKKRGRKPKNKNPELIENGESVGENKETKKDKCKGGKEYTDEILDLMSKVAKLLKVPRRCAPPSEWTVNFPLPKGTMPSKKSNYFRYIRRFNDLPPYDERIFEAFDDDGEEEEVYWSQTKLKLYRSDGEGSDTDSEEDEKDTLYHVEKYTKVKETLNAKPTSSNKIKKTGVKKNRRARKKRFIRTARRRVKPSMTKTIQCRTGGKCQNKLQMYQKHVFGRNFMQKLREERQTERLIKVLCSTPQRTLRHKLKQNDGSSKLDEMSMLGGEKETSNTDSKLFDSSINLDESEQINGNGPSPVKDHSPPEGYFFVEGGVCPDIEPSICGWKSRHSKQFETSPKLMDGKKDTDDLNEMKEDDKNLKADNDNKTDDNKRIKIIVRDCLADDKAVSNTKL